MPPLICEWIILSLVVVRCPDLPDPANGRVELSGNTFGATATYRCISGYRLLGEKTRTCQQNGVWSGEEPRCVRKQYKILICMILNGGTSTSYIEYSNFLLQVLIVEICPIRGMEE